MQKTFLGFWETFEPLSVARGSSFFLFVGERRQQEFKIGILVDVPSQVVQ